MEPVPSDHIAVRHPLMPGEFFVIHRSAFPAHEERGWVEAKSPEAKAAVEATASPDAIEPFKENKS